MAFQLFQHSEDFIASSILQEQFQTLHNLKDSISNYKAREKE